jgi:hypothetical protein
MPELAVLVPGRIETRTGGYEYDRRIVAGLRDRGWRVDVHELDDSFPRPTAAAREDAAVVLQKIPDGGLVIVDGLAFGAMPDQIEREASRLKIVALVHLPLADEPGLDPERAVALEESERRALASASLVVATGRTTAAALTNKRGTAFLTAASPWSNRERIACGSPAAR